MSGQPKDNPWQQAQKEFACDHPNAIVTRMVKSNGSAEYRLQCRRCGVSLRTFRRSELPALTIQSAPEFDDALRRDWAKRREARGTELYKEAQERERREFQEGYSEYLLTPQWRALRAKVLERADHICEGCLDARATQVHHLTYKRVGREMLFDLVAVCDRCHRAIHLDDQDETS